MTEKLRPGGEVIHPQWGFGVVLGVRPGRRARVRFRQQPGLPRTVKEEQLFLVPAQADLAAEPPPGEPAARTIASSTHGDAAGAVAPPPRPELPPPPVWVRESTDPPPARELPPPPRKESRRTTPAVEPETLAPEEVAGYRQTIEALRSGVVPVEHVVEYTVGRERQLTQLRELLEAGRGLRVVWGEYGTGKSHLLDVAEQLALEQGFLTSRITLDRFEIPPSHPQRLYRAIATHLRHPGELGTGLEPLLQRLTESADHRAPEGREFSRFLTPYVHALWKGDDRAIDWMHDYAHGLRVFHQEGRYLLGRTDWAGPPPLTLSDYRTYGRVYANLVGTIASWARDAGFRGLLVLFDEVEFIDSMERELWDFAYEVLAHYAAITVPAELLGFDPDDLYKGGHAVHREMPLRFREDQPLGAIFALTPLEQIESALRLMVRSEGIDLQLDALERRDALDLVERVEELYRCAYPRFRQGPGLTERIRQDVWRRIQEGEDSPRSIVRTVCYWLDLERVS